MNTDEIRAALAAATPGPWDATYDPADRWTSITGQQYGEYVCPEVAICEGDVGTDAHLIANAPTWLAELLAEVDSTRRELGDVHVSLYSEIAMLTARAEAAEATVHLVRGLAEAWATQPTDYDEDTEQQIEDGRAILTALDGGDPT